MLLRCFDVETSDMPPEGGVVEIAWSDVTKDEAGAWCVGPTVESLVNPGGPITPETSAIHHLVDDDVADAPSIGQVLKAYDFMRDDVTAYVAHNAKCESAYIAIGGAPLIDTYKVALVLAPNFPKHTNQALRYRLKLNVDPVASYPAHRAGPDTHVTAHLLIRMLHKLTVKTPIAEVPGDYLDWLLKQPRGEGGFSEDVLHTAFTELQRRRVADKGAA